MSRASPSDILPGPPGPEPRTPRSSISATDPRFVALRKAFAAAPPHRSAATIFGAGRPAEPAPAHASVALLVRPAPADLELLVIKRATRADDPWSGHMAFPGGRSAPDDGSARRTAERETEEEVGVDLARTGKLIAPLSEVWPRAGAPAIVISPWVYEVPEETLTRLNHEVEAAFWIPLRTLAAPGAATEYLHALASGEELRFPAIAYESYVIWGLTHRIMSEFLEVVAPLTA